MSAREYFIGFSILLICLVFAVDGRHKRGWRQRKDPDVADERDAFIPIYPHDWPPSEVERRLKEDDVIPDVLDISPKFVINVSYCPGITVYYGNELDPDEVKKEPQHLSWPIAEGYNYTLIMTGPDDPSVANHFNREFLNWLVVDIPGCDVLKGTVIAKYVPLQMPVETGLHRWVFIVYMQPKLKPRWHEPVMHDHNDGHRVKFSAKKFAKKYNLGDPYAGNYFNSEPEPLDQSQGPGQSAYETGVLKPEKAHHI